MELIYRTRFLKVMVLVESSILGQIHPLASLPQVPYNMMSMFRAHKYFCQIRFLHIISEFYLSMSASKVYMMGIKTYMVG
jgi:hypothetical protein